MIQIQCVITADDQLGAWPPSESGLWCVVRRMHGFTTWRRIQIAQPDPPPYRLAHEYRNDNDN